MATKTLPTDELALGRAVLLATDALGMSAEGAFWLHDDLDNEWHYFLVSSMLDHLGPRKLYLRLNEALAKQLSEDEIARFRFHIASPREKFVQEIRRRAKTNAHASEIVDVEFTVDRRAATAKVYRMAPGLDDHEIKSAQRRFHRRSAEVAVA